MSPDQNHKDCPVFTTLGLIANKWSVSLIYQLDHAKKNTMRFSVLKKALDGISQRELTKHLRTFEAAGLVNRIVYPQSPPRVEYTLTPLGKSLCKPIEALSHWAEENGANVQKNRECYARKNDA